MNAEAENLSDDMVAHYRNVLVVHGHGGGSGACAVCGVARCPNWLDAYDRLAAAHTLMADPAQWDR